MPESANENSAPSVERAELSPEKKAEMLDGAKETWDELQQFDGETLNAEENEAKKSLQIKLHEVMMDVRFGWKDLVSAGLPWDPRLELERMKQNVANDDRPHMEMAA